MAVFIPPFLVGYFRQIKHFHPCDRCTKTITNTGAAIDPIGYDK
jgi:hypothetical protein